MGINFIYSAFLAYYPCTQTYSTAQSSLIPFGLENFNLITPSLRILLTPLPAAGSPVSSLHCLRNGSKDVPPVPLSSFFYVQDQILMWKKNPSFQFLCLQNDITSNNLYMFISKQFQHGKTCVV